MDIFSDMRDDHLCLLTATCCFVVFFLRIHCVGNVGCSTERMSTSYLWHFMVIPFLISIDQKIIFSKLAVVAMWGREVGSYVLTPGYIEMPRGD